MNESYEKLKAHIPDIKQIIGYEFKDTDYLLMAFVHRSFINENRDLQLEHNERLEFLGDSVLGLIVANHLYHMFPDHPEGVLSQVRARLVDAISCTLYLEKLGVKEFILLGRGEEKSQGRDKTSILANVFEAILGAVFLDGGLQAVTDFMQKRFNNDMQELIDSPSINYKAELQDYSQKKFQRPPVYKVMKEEGPDHAKTFHVKVFVGDEEKGDGVGPSKKEAEQKSAFDALQKIEEENE